MWRQQSTNNLTFEEWKTYEIQKRRNDQTAHVKTSSLDWVWRARLTKLNRRRHGNHFIEESDAGRAMLTALLCFGLTAENAMARAPWLEEREFQVLQRAARWMRRSDVGEPINLTIEEWEDCRLWITLPVASAEDIAASRKRRKKESWRRSKQKQRDRRRHEAERVKRIETERVKERPDALDHKRRGWILALITHAYEYPRRPIDGGAERTLSELMKQLIAESRRGGSVVEAFCVGGTWPPRAVKNLRYVVWRAVKQLAAAGQIGTRLTRSEHGPERVVWLTPNNAQGCS
jgi:hypothetical protein